MLKRRAQFVFALVAITLVAPICARPQQATGALEVNVKNVKIDGKPARLSRKRFYVFAGGLKENAALIERIKAAKITSRNCYYKGLQASDNYICWLQAENCESPFCRVVDARYLDANDKQAVPEFLTAYNKGLTLFKNKPDIARQWLLTNMPDNLVNGFYRQQQTLLASVLGGLTPLRSSMTDTAGFRSIFVDFLFPDPKVTRVKYLVSNVLPIEIGNKSYVWTCEKDVETGKKAVLDLSKAGTNCQVAVRDLPQCETKPCEQK